MKRLTGLFTGLLLIVLGGVSHAQNPSNTNPLMGEWEFVEITISMDGTSSATHKCVGSITIDANSFSGQLIDAAVPTTVQPEKLSGTYTLDVAKGVAVVRIGTIRIGFRYRLVQKKSENYLELEFSVEDAFSKEELDSMISEEQGKLLEELKKTKCNILLKRKQ